MFLVAPVNNPESEPDDMQTPLGKAVAGEMETMKLLEDTLSETKGY